MRQLWVMMMVVVVAAVVAAVLQLLAVEASGQNKAPAWDGEGQGHALRMTASDGLVCVIVGQSLALRPIPTAHSGGAGLRGFGAAEEPASGAPTVARCWGRNRQGELGRSDPSDHVGDMGLALHNVDFGHDPTTGAPLWPIRFFRGLVSSHMCAVLNDRSLKCWGWNRYGQLGQGSRRTVGSRAGTMGDSLDAVNLGTGLVVRSGGCGRRFTCAIVAKRPASSARLGAGHGALLHHQHPPALGVKCFGHSFVGELGLGVKGDVGVRPEQMGDNLPFVDFGSHGYAPLHIAVGNVFSCVLFANHRLKCWGNNQFGQLGYAHREHVGGSPDRTGAMGDALPFVDVGASNRVHRFCVGFSHTCALIVDDEEGEGGSSLGSASVSASASATGIPSLVHAGRIKCWGDSNLGQTGHGSTEARGDDPGEMGDALPFVDLGRGVRAVDVACSDANTCALLTDGRIKCWGSNSWGQLGLGLPPGGGMNKGDQPGAMGDALPTVDLGGSHITAKAIRSGVGFVCAVLSNDQVKCWGRNDDGQLGQGHTTPMNSPRELPVVAIGDDPPIPPGFEVVVQRSG